MGIYFYNQGNGGRYLRCTDLSVTQKCSLKTEGKGTTRYDDGRTATQGTNSLLIELLLILLMDNEADAFYEGLPKVELHAHLNGSVSFQTIEKLIRRKPQLNIEHSMTAIGKGQRRTLDECFQVFKVIHQLVDSEEDIFMVATDVIKEFAADGVKYLELRSTPREETTTGLTKRRYIETVIKYSKLCTLTLIIKRFLVAIDRRNGSQVAMETVQLAEEFLLSSDGLVIGIDLSGDPTVGHGRDLLSALQKAKDSGLKLSLHLSEVCFIIHSHTNTTIKLT
uniref:Adenosine deaminase domain-containing protein n=1 Tax=Periophthalmus magnuspinnatus TaxID=409849 RepID=A0A3B3ZVI0_9GOBI